MNIFFSGIGGVGLGPLAQIARAAGNTVTGSDASESLMVQQLRNEGIAIEIATSDEFLRASHASDPIDWFVHTAALADSHPELVAARELGLRISKRDELLAHILQEKQLKLIAVAGTHGKTTTTGMLVWAFKQLNIPVSYSIGTTISFGPSGAYDPDSEYFIYECDEFDRNFLHFNPFLSVITNVGYDHSDTYPNEKDYTEAFQTFMSQSNLTISWQAEIPNPGGNASWLLAGDEVQDVALAGEHSRKNATLVLKALEYLNIATDAKTVESFPGTNRRFEKLAEHIYSDYGHHPTEIAATLQMANELSDRVALVYQPHQNIRQYEIRDSYTDDCFAHAASVYWLPTYLSREDPNLPVLTQGDLTVHLTEKTALHVAQLDDALWQTILQLRSEGMLVLCMGAGSIDGWVRDKCTTLT